MKPEMTADKKIDPVLVSVLQRRLKSITGEMGLTLLRTTRSPTTQPPICALMSSRTTS